MKKVFYTLLLITVAFSCTSRKQSDDSYEANILTFDTIRIVEKIKLLEHGIDTLPRAEVFIELIYPKSRSSRTDLKKLQSLFYQTVFDERYISVSSPQQAIDRYIKNYTKEYREDASYFEEELRENPDPDIEDEFRYANYSKLTHINNEIVFYNKHLLSFKSNLESVQSGKIYRETKCSSINLSSVKKLTEDDIFNLDYEEPLNQIIRSKLLVAVTELLDDVESAQDPKKSLYDFYSIHANGNFMIDDKGLHYIYNPNEVAPPLFGMFEIDIEFEEIGHLLSPEVLSGLEIDAQHNLDISEQTNKTDGLTRQEEINWQEFPVAYVKEGMLHFFSPKNQIVKQFTEESDSVFNCVFSDKDDIFYYTVSQNGVLSFRQADFGMSPVQISFMKELKKPANKFFTETYGEKAKLSFFNGNLLLECDFSWDIYAFSQYFEYVADNNTISVLDWEKFIDRYFSYIKKYEPDKDYAHIYERAIELLLPDEQIDVDEIEYFFTEETADKSKIIFSILTGFGDLPHGPYCVANKDGSMIKILEDTDMGSKFKPTWSDNNAVYIRKRWVGEESVKELCYTIEATNESVVIDNNVDYYTVKR